MPCLALPRVWQQRPRLARSNELRAKQRLGVVRGSRCLVLALSGFCGGARGRSAFLGARTRRVVPNHKHDKRGQESRGAHRGRRQPGRRMGRQRPESPRLPVAGKGREGEERSTRGGGDFPFMPQPTDVALPVVPFSVFPSRLARRSGRPKHLRNFPPKRRATFLAGKRSRLLTQRKGGRSGRRFEFLRFPAGTCSLAGGECR